MDAELKAWLKLLTQAYLEKSSTIELREDQNRLKLKNKLASKNPESIEEK